MSTRPGRHQRRPSQSVFMDADFLSEPPAESGVDKAFSPPAHPPQQSRPAAEIPPPRAPATADSSRKEDREPTDRAKRRQ